MDTVDNQNKILIVDDDRAIRSLMKHLLEKNGYTCTPAIDAESARKALKTEHFHLALCDIEMPGESGLELARYILSEYPDTGIVMVTVIGDQETAKSILEMGVFGYILKPFDKNQVLIGVVNALRRRELEIKHRHYQDELESMVRERTAEISKVNEILVKRESEVRTQKQELEEVNNALRILLKKREDDKAALEENVITNFKRTVEPFLEKLRNGRLTQDQMEILSIIESGMQDIISPFVKALSSLYLDLTPAEIQVAQLIKHGKTTKEIATVLNLSENTIMSHRYNIRSKLGLLNKKTNLTTFLHTLNDQ